MTVMVPTDKTKQSIWPRTPTFRSFSSFSISSKTLSFVKSASITFTVFPVVSSGEKWQGGTSISNSWTLESCSQMWCHPVIWLMKLIFFIYIFLLISLATTSRSALLLLMMTTFIPCWASCRRQRSNIGQKDGRNTHTIRKMIPQKHCIKCFRRAVDQIKINK